MPSITLSELDKFSNILKILAPEILDPFFLTSDDA
jgi:hypothetical protein